MKINKKFLLIVLIGLSLCCNSGDESSVSEELNGVALGTYETPGLFWIGHATLDTCAYTSMDLIPSFDCAFIQTAQGTIDNFYPQNMILFLLKTTGTNSASGNMEITVPHMDMLPHTYSINVEGNFVTSLDTGVTFLTLSPSEFISPSEDEYYMNITWFGAEVIEENLQGTIRMNLYRSSISGTLSLSYSFIIFKNE